MEALGVRVQVRVGAIGGTGAHEPGTGYGAPLCIPLRHLNWDALERLVIQWHHAKGELLGTARSEEIVEHFLGTVAGNVNELKMRIYSNGDMISGPQDDRLLRECLFTLPLSMRYWIHCIRLFILFNRFISLHIPQAYLPILRSYALSTWISNPQYPLHSRPTQMSSPAP
jgi:hypothetical protein